MRPGGAGRAVGAALAVLVLAPGPADGQDVRTAVVADTIRVGDVVPVAARVTVEPGSRVIWPDTLPLGDLRAENAARLRERIDTLSDGRLDVTAVYSVTPWVPGELPLPELSVEVVTGDGSTRRRVAGLPTLEVRSVLPDDTAGLEPQPPKGVIGRSWAWGPIAAALLALAALVAAFVYWLRRRRRAGGAVEVPTARPRERALAELQEALDSGLLDRGAVKPFYSRITHAVRGYAAALNDGWGEDLTTTEIVGRLRRQAGPGEAVALAEVLRAADQVKFARRRPDPETARGEWTAARDWVSRFDWPPPPVPQEEAA